MTSERLLAALGGVAALIAVALGAFGAHALRARLAPDLLAVFETGARYQMYHALAMRAAALAYGRWATAQTLWAGWLFTAGILVFSGSLYLLALTGARWWGAITPVGGLCFLLGWIAFIWGALAESR
jgi:uncharacterized membrane protein YgdD (TMEM256/DUF423 family)